MATDGGGPAASSDSGVGRARWYTTQDATPGHSRGHSGTDPLRFLTFRRLVFRDREETAAVGRLLSGGGGRRTCFATQTSSRSRSLLLPPPPPLFSSSPTVRSLSPPTPPPHPPR